MFPEYDHFYNKSREITRIRLGVYLTNAFNLCIKNSTKLAILLKMGARGWGIWKNHGPGVGNFANKIWPWGTQSPPLPGEGVRGAKI